MSTLLDRLVRTHGCVDDLTWMKARARRDARRPNALVFAVEDGWLTVAQAREIADVMDDSGRSFAQVAREDHYLTHDELTRLTHALDAATPAMSEVLLEMGALDMQALRALLRPRIVPPPEPSLPPTGT